MLLLAASVAAGVQLFELGKILWFRLNYLYDVHWMESATLLTVHRLMHGEPIYPELGRENGFLPNVYPPVLYFALAGVSAIFGLDYATGRAFSIVVTTAGALLLAHEVHQRFRGLPLPLVPALLTLGAIAAGFPITGGWYDATMTDPLALTLLLVATKLVLRSTTEPARSRVLVAAAVLVLTVYTKQSYVIMAAWEVLFLAFFSLRRALLLAATTLALAVILLGLAQYLTRGTFLSYAGTNVLRHFIDSTRFSKGIGVILTFAPYLPLAFLASVFLAIKRALSRSSLCWMGTLLFSGLLALAHYAKIGGWDNNFMPVVVLAPAAAFCVLGDLLRLLRPHTTDLVLAVCGLGAAVYLLLRRYPADEFAARKYRRVAAAKLNDFVAKMEGDVLIPARPFLAVRNGARVEQVHVMAWFDALTAGRKDLSFEAFMHRTHPRYVILADQEPAVMVEAMARDYYTTGRIPAELWLVQTLEGSIGASHDPNVPAFPGQLHWVLERNQPEPPGTRCLFDFESKTFDGFTASGDAFADGPAAIDELRGKLLFASWGSVVGVIGDRYASSFSKSVGDAAVGRLDSAPFVIDRRRLRLRVGGSVWASTRVELRIDDALAHVLVGTGSNLLAQIDLDLRGMLGKTARLAIIDDDPYTHLLVDHICLVP